MAMNPPTHTHRAATLTYLQNLSKIPLNPNLTLTKERSNLSFDPLLITHLLDGGPAQTHRRRQIEHLVQGDPVIFSNQTNNHLSRLSRHKRALAKHARMISLMTSLNIKITDPDETNKHLEEFSMLLNGIADDLPTSLHWVMFIPNIHSLFSDSQKAWILPMCERFEMIGCYAQTELGHGSNVRGLETTATYNNFSDTFTLHSPTLTSLKFWPGSLGLTSNHAVVIAQLIIDGKSYGNHNFLVQLRELDSHELLPGVITGDIGPKLGYNNMDNGFACFDKVSIPRTNMAMRFSKVEKGGKYIVLKKDDATEKISYLTMMQVRAHIVNEAGKHLGMAATIAIRYSAVRLQGWRESSSTPTPTPTPTQKPVENQILDYTTQQHRLFGVLACSYCFHFTGRLTLARLKQYERALLSGKGNITKPEIQDLHASSSALKAFCSTVAADGIEDCRKSCGGNGYLVASGFPEMLNTYLQNPTVEGDNAMLPQQVCRVLLKVAADVGRASNKAEFSQVETKYERCDSRYLVDELKFVNVTCKATTPFSMRSTTILLGAFAHRTARLLLRVEKMLKKKSWNDCLVEMARCSRAHASYLLLRNFSRTISSSSSGDGILREGSGERAVIENLFRLFGSWLMEKDIGDFSEDGYLSLEQIGWVRENVLKLLGLIRGDAVGLVDARDFSDFRLKSCLGREDGNVYEALFASCLEEPLNAVGTEGEKFNLTGVSKL